MGGHSGRSSVDVKTRSPLRIATLYVAAAVAWIILSDRLLALVLAPDAVAIGQTVKGLVFVLLTGLLLYALHRHTHRELANLQSRLLARQEAYRTRLESLPVAVISLRGDHIIWANRQGRRMLDLPLQPANGPTLDAPPPTLRDRIAPESREALDRTLAAALDHPAPQTSERITLRGPADRAITAVISAVRSESQPQAVIELAALDITELVRLEAQVRRNEQLAAVGKFVATVAHDLNNMMTAVSGYTSIARDQVRDNHPARESIDQVAAAAAQADGLVRSLLTFSRGFSAPKSPADIRIILAAAVDATRPLLPDNITMLFDGAPPNPGAAPLLVACDRIQLQRAFLNLITNARDAMPSGGVIRVTARRDGPSARIDVADQGVGIPADMIDTIFEPFFTTKPGEKGSGLGLAIVAGVVKDHGGAISVRSTQGSTVFTVTLPLLDADAARPRGEPSSASPAASPAALVVENNDLVAELIRDVLAANKWRVDTARSPDEAVERASRPGAHYSVCIMDEDLAGGIGTQTLRALRARGIDIPTVIMTAGQPPAGADVADAAVLIKPFTPDHLLAVVETARRRELPAMRTPPAAEPL